MSLLELYYELYEHEKDGNSKVLAMLESVPEASRSDARFQQAIMLAGHLAACRENWLDRMVSKEDGLAAWWDPGCELGSLRSRYAALEHRWTEYIAYLDEDRLAQEFEFSESGEERFRLPLEVQIVQLFGHASYHRGQIVLLVDQVGGEMLDTDYVDWWWSNRREKS